MTLNYCEHFGLDCPFDPSGCGPDSCQRESGEEEFFLPIEAVELNDVFFAENREFLIDKNF